MIPIHPGEILADELNARGMTASDLAGGDPKTTLAIDLLLACADPSFSSRKGVRMGSLVDVIATGLRMNRETWIRIEQSMVEHYELLAEQGG